MSNDTSRRDGNNASTLLGIDSSTGEIRAVKVTPTGGIVTDGGSPAVAALADGTANPTTTLIGAMLQVYNGTTWDRLRIPNVFKPLDATSINAEATIWDPANGKKFRLMGFHLSSSVAGNVLIKDGNGGSTIVVVPLAAAGPGISVDLGNGILSALADNNLRAIGPATATLSGVVWGTEE